MAKRPVYNRITITYESTITLNETEMRALDALVGYGDKAFIEAFKEKLGAAYLRDHESGLISFFANVRQHIVPAISQVEKAREAVKE